MFSTISLCYACLGKIASVVAVLVQDFIPKSGLEIFREAMT